MSKRNLFEYRRPVTLGPTGLLIDDIITGFEASTITGWSSVAVSPATLSIITTDSYHGDQCLRIYSPTYFSKALMQRVATKPASGIHRLMAAVKPIVYYGSNVNDYQYVGVESTVSPKRTLSFVVSGYGVSIQHHGTNVTILTTPLELGVWHLLEAECNYSTKTSRFWVDSALMGTYVDGTVYAPKILYLGDDSQTIGRGDYYWDTVLFGTLIV
jgi:hypothetical protein